jgi:ketosteroid isomerase-like protein
VSDEEAVRTANDVFYRALEALDLDAMQAVWLHEPWVRCVHPGWDVLVGWDAVRESWRRIFEGTGWMGITPTEVAVHVIGDAAIAACTENITTKADDQVAVGVAHATNVFRQTRAGWRMVVHHASPTPVRVSHPFTGSVQ